MGRKKIAKSDFSGMNHDRDINAAKNILSA